MKIGIVVIFQNDENAIDVEKYISLFSKNTKLHLCFVTNESSDNTRSLLKEIQEEVQHHISILDIKKNRGTEAAVKAGIRYLNSAANISHIVCIQEFTIKTHVMLQNVVSLAHKDKKQLKHFFTNLKRLPYKNVFLLEEEVGKSVQKAF